MGEISSELIKFKNSVSPAIKKMRGDVSDIQSTVSDFVNANNSAMNNISSSYKSKNKSTIIGSFSSINEGCNSVINALSGDLNGILSSCDSLKAQIAELESINSKISEWSTIANSKTESDERKSLAKSKIIELNKDFEAGEKKAESALSALKGSGGAVSIGSGLISAADSISMTGDYTFTLEEIVVNGVKMKCYVYRPAGVSSTEKLPVMQCMYGIGFENKGTSYMTNSILGKMITEGKVHTKAIYVIPYVQNGRQYEDKNFRDLLAQLPFEVAKKYNGDEERVSLAGNSYGAVMAYKMVTENPGKFSAVFAANGANDVTDAFRGVKVYNYTGRGDSNHINLKYIEEQSNKINEVGGESTYTLYHDWGHTKTGNRAFEETMTDSDGNTIYVFEDLLKYKRRSA